MLMQNDLEFNCAPEYEKMYSAIFKKFESLNLNQKKAIF